MNGLLGKRVQIVFTDSTTLAGELTTADAQKFTLENMRQQRISYPINTIAEIYFDTLS